MASDAVLIRGIDRPAYNKVVAKAKEQGRNVADLVNEAIRSYLNEGPPARLDVYDTKKIVVEPTGSLALSRHDLVVFHQELGPFQLENGGDLTFEHDVMPEDMQKIGGIHNTGKLRVPAHIHPHILMKAGRVHGEVEKYQPTMSDLAGSA